MENTDKCRRQISLISISFLRTISPFLGIYTLLSLLPAFFSSCSDDIAGISEKVQKDIGIFISDETVLIRNLDVFIFMDDKMEKLECYQRIDDVKSWNRKVLSGTGDRIIAVCANSGNERERWLEVSSRAYLKGMSRSLEDENRQCLFMFGEVYAKAGSTAEIPLHPISSEIVLRSISCDFSGKPYSGEKLKDVRVYLTNVNAECRIFPEGYVKPTRIINSGRLDEDDLQKFNDPSLIMQNLDKDIGKQTIYPDIRLLCYPNNSSEESPGTPFTRIVIEGKVGEDIYYWPLEINSDGDGITMNHRYIFDVKITRKGSTDPDIPIELKDAEIIFTATSWEEKEDCTIEF